MKAPTVELTVDAIALGGSGVGRTAAGQVVFVPRTVPGDRIRVELTERRRRWARGRLLELYESGPGRVAPPCPHFDECGGCQLLHLAPEPQIDALRRGIEDALRRIGRVDVPVREVKAGGRRLGYRNRVTFTLRRRGGRVLAGYHAVRGSGLIDVVECPLAEPALTAAWRALRSAWGPGAGALPAGAELRLTLRSGATGKVALLVSGGSDPGRGRGRGAAAIMAGVSALASYWWIGASGERRHLGGARTLSDRWHGLELELEPQAFVQVNREIAERIEHHLDDELGPTSGLELLDLYAGVGLRAIRWAGGGADVTAVESAPDAVRTGRRAAAAADVSPRFVSCTVEEALPHLPAADTIVVNPPRSGLSPEAAAGIARLTATRLAYVSCNPGTLARDVTRLAPGWRPRFAQPFDAFPQTGHVETVLWFDRERTAR